ncbi:MAG: haloacid dehalogenase type II [Pseudomonadota bacterium]|nr:haloacid dehalogenase type II [Pseudomonadota bacterium]
MPITHCIFDAYGTLFDVAGAARAAAATPEGAALSPHWAQLAAHWRAKQLEYTWLRAITGDHADFQQVTQDGLDWSLEAMGLDGDPALRAQLLDLYRTLPAYPEVPAMLQALNGAGYTCAILSNGTPQMLSDAVTSAGIGDQLDALLSIEDVGVYKPARAVYDLVRTRYGTQPEEVLFVSSNGWDAAGASGYGFNVLWVNRAGQPVDRMPHKPTRIERDLTNLPHFIKDF